MSFDDKFESRWEKVIVPAICSIKVEGVQLQPHRVDTSRISDSILSEILDGISIDKLVLADVTTISHTGSKAIRNGNVMYEVGIAHAIRLPEEVILFRSDSDEVLFDIANVRLNSYDPDGNCNKAREAIVLAIEEALKETELARHLAIEEAARILDITSWSILINALGVGKGSIKESPTRNWVEVVGNSAKNDAIRRLLGLGALETDFQLHTADSIGAMKHDTEMFSYKLTPFGRALIENVVSKTVDFPELRGKWKRAIEVLIDGLGSTR